MAREVRRGSHVRPAPHLMSVSVLLRVERVFDSIEPLAEFGVFGFQRAEELLLGGNLRLESVFIPIYPLLFGLQCFNQNGNQVRIATDL
jgi:hypothetical protein